MSDKHLVIEGILLDQQPSYTLVEICQICVVEESTLHEMMDFGIIEPHPQQEQLIFNAQALYRAKKALRLHHDLAINWAGVALALDLLEEIKDLKAKLASGTYQD